VHRRSIDLDGETVVLLCPSLTVGELGDLTAAGYPRGVATEDRHYARRCALIDQHLGVERGTLVVDGRPVSGGLASLFGGRPEVIGLLYGELLMAQQVSADEAHDLKVAARFTQFLGQQSAKDAPTNPWAKTGTSCGRCHQMHLCESRGCDGTKQTRVVWRDKGMVLKTCPVRSFTPRIEQTLRLFYGTHTMTQTPNGGLQWEQRTAVAEGGYEQQDAWTMHAFQELRHVHMQMAQEMVKAA